MLKNNSLKLKKVLPVILIYVVMVVMALIANIINPGFLSVDNVYSIVKQVAFLGIACIGQTLIILTGGIDLSLRYVILLSNVLAAQMINGREEYTWTTFGFIMLVCVAIGIVNGAGVTFLKIPAMVMTLAMGTVLYGITLLYCKGAPGGHAPDALQGNRLPDQTLFVHFFLGSGFFQKPGPNLIAHPVVQVDKMKLVKIAHQQNPFFSAV